MPVPCRPLPSSARLCPLVRSSAASPGRAVVQVARPLAPPLKRQKRGSMTIANTPTPLPPPAPPDPERDLIAAIFRQALADLRPSAAPVAHATAMRFWRRERGDLAWWCELLDLDTQQVQRRIAQRYPEIVRPTQLEMDLEVPS